MDAKLLRRVVPIALTSAWGDGQLNLVSLEIYEDGSILHYRLLGQGRLTPDRLAAEFLAADPMFKVEDDARHGLLHFLLGRRRQRQRLAMLRP